MSIQSKMESKGYDPIACSGDIGVGFQGKRIDMWCWNGKTIKFTDGTYKLCSVQAKTMKDLAINYFLKKWIPLTEITDELLQAMENELRSIQGGVVCGYNVSEGLPLKKIELPKCGIMPEIDTSDKEEVSTVSAGAEGFIKSQKIMYGG